MVAASTTAVTTATPRGFALSRNYVLRYVAAVSGLVALIGFYQPWVRADLNGIGAAPLSGIELARNDASTRVDNALFGPGARAGSGAPAAAGAAGSSGAAGGAGSASSVANSSGTGGLVLPTRQPTAVSSSQSSSQVIGGLTLPTRVPTAAAGSAGASQIVGGALTGSNATPVTADATATPLMNAALVGGAPVVAAAPAPEPPPPDTLPKVSLYLVPLMALGIVAFSFIWDRLTDPRDRRNGKVWTLILSLGGTAWIGALLVKVLRAPSDNVLIGPGVGGVTGAEPALWATFLGFLLAAVCLVWAWLSPTPPAPDPYWRARATSN
jgi:hypothetical protein